MPSPSTLQELAAILGLVAREQTDEELVAAAIEDAVVLAVLGLPQWRVVLANDARGELLDIASSGDAAGVVAFLESLSVSLRVETG